MTTNSLDHWEQPPEGAGPKWFQDRGRAFEKLLRWQLESEGLAPRINIRPSGEEIDGSFVLGDRAFLMEAKWRKDAIPASDLYAFKGKVDGKLVGTLGVFVSMSGYSRDAIDALKFGKEINIILFSGGDFRLVAKGAISFADAVRRKLRYASEEGQPYLPLAPDESTLEGPPGARQPHASIGGEAAAPSWDIVVEGVADEEGLRIIFDRLDPTRRATVRIWAAGGQLALPSLVRRLRESGRSNVAAFVESDATPKLLTELQSQLPDETHLVVVSPNIEEWLENACSAEYVNAVPPTSIKAKASRRYGRNADLAVLLASNPQFAALTNRILRGAFG